MLSKYERERERERQTERERERERESGMYFGVFDCLAVSAYTIWIDTASQVSLVLCILGAFLIPYVIMMILIGMPLLFMEYSIGQYFGIGSLSVFKKVCPLFQGS